MSRPSWKISRINSTFWPTSPASLNTSVPLLTTSLGMLLFCCIPNNYEFSINFFSASAILSDLINYCLEGAESKAFVSPREKHCYVRVCALCIFLIDRDDPDPKNAFKLDKYCDIAKCKSLFRVSSSLLFIFVRTLISLLMLRKSPLCHCMATCHSVWPLCSTNVLTTRMIGVFWQSEMSAPLKLGSLNSPLYRHFLI